MKKLALCLLLICSSSFAQVPPYSNLIRQYDVTGLNLITYAIAPPSSGGGYFYFNPTNNLPEFQPASSLSISASQISDSSAIGRDLLTATTKANARSAIDAGTSSFSGDYNDLTNRITNNNQLTNGSGFITALTAPVTSVNSKTGSVTLTNTDVGAAATSHNHTASQVSDSTTIGRSLLTAANQAAVQSIVGMATQVNSDWSSTSGVSQILNKPAKYSGATNGSGIYTVTYGSAYSVKPHLVFSVEGGTNKDTAVLTSTTTTGFSILIERRSDVLGLLPTYAVVSGITVNVTVTP